MNEQLRDFWSFELVGDHRHASLYLGKRKVGTTCLAPLPAKSPDMPDGKPRVLIPLSNAERSVIKALDSYVDENFFLSALLSAFVVDRSDNALAFHEPLEGEWEADNVPLKGATFPRLAVVTGTDGNSEPVLVARLCGPDAIVLPLLRVAEEAFEHDEEEGVLWKLFAISRRAVVNDPARASALVIEAMRNSELDHDETVMMGQILSKYLDANEPLGPECVPIALLGAILEAIDATDDEDEIEELTYALDVANARAHVEYDKASIYLYRTLSTSMYARFEPLASVGPGTDFDKLAREIDPRQLSDACAITCGHLLALYQGEMPDLCQRPDPADGISFLQRLAAEGDMAMPGRAHTDDGRLLQLFRYVLMPVFIVFPSLAVRDAEDFHSHFADFLASRAVMSGNDTQH